tara:strand:- start:540 stop:1871 length:1332 start_codon:yes stop_codon:yes gene_type:complete
MATTYLTKQITTAGSRKKATISLWVKRGANFGNDQRFFSYENTSVANDVTVFKFSGDYIQFADQTGGSNNARFDGSRYLRDPNAWYHFVVKIDTTQSTNTDRLKVYINGDLESTGSYTYPSQDASINIGHNSNAYIDIGRWRGSNNQYFEGAITHFHYTDGYAYDASTFGETDSTTGEWKIKTSPSVTYGTNGFFLLKDNNGVTDQSGQSNNYTVGGGTLTALQDNPSNNFAKLNSIIRTANGAFSNSNNTYTTSNSAWTSGFSSIGMEKNSGKYYMEFKGLSGTKFGFGICDMSNSGVLDRSQRGEDRYVGEYLNSYGYHYGGNFYYNGSSTGTGYDSFTSSNVIGMAVDMENMKIYFHKDGTYQNSGNPTNGTNGYTIADPDNAYFPTISVEAASASINSGDGVFGTTAISSEGTNANSVGKFEYDVPTGYTALSTKGLNL